MKSICALFMSAVITLSCVPSTARAETNPALFLLPDGRTDEAYEVSVESVLREQYGLRVQPPAQTARLRWSYLDGELPTGLAVDSDGVIAGTPAFHREQPFRFRVAVGAHAIEPLVLDLSLNVKAPRVRLTKIDAAQSVAGMQTAVGSAAAPLASSYVNSAAVSERSKTDTAPPAGMPSNSNEEHIGRAPNITLAHRGPPKSLFYAPIEILSRQQEPPSYDKPFPVSRSVTGILRKDPPAEAASCAARSSNIVVSDEAAAPLKGEVRNQPTCVKFKNLNVIKYKIGFDRTPATTPGPDISKLPFLAALPSTNAPSAATGGDSQPKSPALAMLKAITAQKAAAFIAGLDAQAREEKNDAQRKADRLAEDLKKLDERFNRLVTELNEREKDRRDVEIHILAGRKGQQEALARALQLADQADDDLQSGAVTRLLAKVSDVDRELESARAADYPDREIAAVLDALGRLSTASGSLRLNEKGLEDVLFESWTEWVKINQPYYDRVKQRTSELTTALSAIDGKSEQAKAFNDSKIVLGKWQTTLKGVEDAKENAFQRSVYVTCTTIETENQTSKLTISKLDRTQSGAAATPRDVLTVSCSSRLVITAGINFSTLNEKEFSVVQSAGADPNTVVKKFGFTSQSPFRPNPLILLNLRLSDRPVYNWYASFGALVDLKGKTGADLETLAGISFSLRRTFFITPAALHIGRVSRLAGGFKVGDLVPDTVATPPIEKSWRLGYTAAISFRIAPQQ